MNRIFSKSNDLHWKRQNLLLLVVPICIFGLLGFGWTYKLDIFPGLHADEAWSGLKALHFRKHNVDQLTGMNNYTGILEVLTANLSFELFRPGVLQLRIGGVFFNMLGLIIMFYSLRFCTMGMGRIIFLLLITQSSLFVISPRIAWEVNTFTLFFLSLAFISFLKVKENPQRVSFFWVVLFLLSNLLGTYNHILFSCLSISALIGVVLWSLRYKSERYKELAILLSINFVILGVLFLTMHYCEDFKNLSKIPLILVNLFLLLGFSFGYYQLIKKRWVQGIKINLSKSSVNVILILSVGSFILFHGIAFFQVFSSYKLILQVYSYECSAITEILLIIVGFCTICCLLVQLIRDLKKGISPLIAFIVIAYLGVFNIYTIGVSLRYYLALYALVCIYLTQSISSDKRLVWFLLSPAILGFFVVQGLIFDILITNDRPLRAIDFKIGNRQKETSAHFLPKQPILHFLKVNKIGQIEYLVEDPYFINDVLLYYKAINPWEEQEGKRAFVDYDFTKNNTGFLLYLEEK